MLGETAVSWGPSLVRHFCLLTQFAFSLSRSSSSSSHQDDLVQVHWWWAFGHDHGQHRHQQCNCYVCQWLSEHSWQGLQICTPNFFLHNLTLPPKKQVAKIHSQWLGTLASAVHLATESHCCGIWPYGVRFMLPVCICWSLSGWSGDNIW